MIGQDSPVCWHKLSKFGRTFLCLGKTAVTLKCLWKISPPEIGFVVERWRKLLC